MCCKLFRNTSIILQIVNNVDNLTNKGEVYGCGHNANGVFGTSNFSNQTLFTQIPVSEFVVKSFINADVCTEIMRSNKFNMCGEMFAHDESRVSMIKHLGLKRIGKKRGWMKRSKTEATIASTVKNEKQFKIICKKLF